MNKVQDIGFLVLRIVAGVLMLTHGLPKLMAFPDLMNQFPDPIGLGSPVALALVVGAEVGCSILLILGIATRLAAIPLLITMLVASLIIHAQDPFAKQELPLLYASIYVALFFTGTGCLGLGPILFKNRFMH